MTDEQDPVVELMEKGDVTQAGAIVILYSAIRELKRDMREFRQAVSDDLGELMTAVTDSRENHEELADRVSAIEKELADNPSLIKLLKTRPKQTTATLVAILALVMFEILHWVEMSNGGQLPNWLDWLNVF